MEFNFQKHVSLLPGGYLLMVQGSATPKATDHIHLATCKNLIQGIKSS